MMFASCNIIIYISSYNIEDITIEELFCKDVGKMIAITSIRQWIYFVRYRNVLSIVLCNDQGHLEKKQ